MPRFTPLRSTIAIASALVAVACAPRTAPNVATGNGTSADRSPAGQWDGLIHEPGSPPMRLTITLDSASGAWSGSVLVPQMSSKPISIASATHVRDSIVIHLPAAAQGAIFSGQLSADGRQLAGRVNVGDRVTFATARAGSAEAAELAATVSRVDASRRLAASMADTSHAAAHADPDSAKLVTSDIALFWHALDVAPPDSLAAVLQREYLDKASAGVLDFIPGRILSAEDLAAYVQGHRARYDSVRAAKLDVTRADSAIRVAFHRLKDIYPDAVFPDVYFVVGRFNSGGTSSRHGLLIGAEMYRDPAKLPAIVSHELIHYQQHYPNRTLLAHSFLEGSADFVGELISGEQINKAAHEYGLAHEHELWQEFTPHFADSTYYPWMYGRPADGRPNDLGYFIGYRIAKAYYDRAADRKQAIYDIITARGGNVKELLEMSGYDP